MKKIFITILALSFLVLTPLWAAADTIEGSVQGYTCVTQGKLCPVGKEDPMAAVENVFVVLTEDNDYFFVLNLDRAVLARHINDQVRVTGRLSPKYPAITAYTLDVFKRGAWRTTWEVAWQQRFYTELYGGVYVY